VKYFALVMLALVMLAGCSALSNPGAAPVFTPEAECVRAGGFWHQVQNICEYNFSALPPLQVHRVGPWGGTDVSGDAEPVTSASSTMVRKIGSSAAATA